jgi:hypothetical protein
MFLSPSIHKFDNEFIQTSAERLDMSSTLRLRPEGSSSTCLSRGPQDLVLLSAMSSIRPELMAEGKPNGVSNFDVVNNQNTLLYLRIEALSESPNLLVEPDPFRYARHGLTSDSYQRDVRLYLFDHLQKLFIYRQIPLDTICKE